MSVKVELGFTPSGDGPFFVLDDATKGVLDSTSYVLGGEVLGDVTEYVRSFRIGRGKSLELDRFTAGAASINFDNNTRAFDPTYTASPYYGQIQPKRRIRVSIDDIIQFDGTIDDWDINYEPAGDSVATANAFDAVQTLTNQALSGYDPDVELSGARINDVLDAVAWPTDKRNIDEGSAILNGNAVADGTNVFEYLQLVAQSEPGDLFISKQGEVKFVDRYTAVTGDTIQFSDESGGVVYAGISALVGSELLFNNITVSSSAGTATATNTSSVDIYGEIDYQLQTLIENEADLQVMADFLLEKYATPKYRINNLGINLTNMSTSDRTDVLGLDLGDIIAVTFTPSGIPPAIVSYAKVIRLDANIEPNAQAMTIGLEALSGVVMLLDNAEFGKLDSGYFLGGPYSAWTLNDVIYGRLSAGMTVS